MLAKVVYNHNLYISCLAFEFCVSVSLSLLYVEFLGDIVL